MGEWDQDRADITGRTIEANIPPAFLVPTRGQTWLLVLAIGVPLALAVGLIVVYGR